MMQDTIYPDYRFIEELESGYPFQAEACFQCRKCTNGCPVSFAMDLFPDEVIRMVILGQWEKVLSCQTIWICAACETCTTRCPNEVKIAELMDHLKEMSVQQNISCPQPQVLAFHEMFLKNVRHHGRVFESTLLPSFLVRSGSLYRKWKDGTWLTEAKLGWKMFIKGKLHFWPKRNRGKKEIQNILTRSQ